MGALLRFETWRNVSCRTCGVRVRAVTSHDNVSTADADASGQFGCVTRQRTRSENSDFERGARNA